MNDFEEKYCNPFSLWIKIQRENIDFLNRVYEGYDYLCTVSTIDSAEGIIRLWGYGKIGAVKRVLKGLPFDYEIIKEEH